MISSVIAKLNTEFGSLEKTLEEISSHPDMETGALVDDRLLPVTIESNGRNEMEELTRWLQSREGIAHVDVVFVHFEEDDEPQKPQDQFHSSFDSKRT